MSGKLGCARNRVLSASFGSVAAVALAALVVPAAGAGELEAAQTATADARAWSSVASIVLDDAAVGATTTAAMATIRHPSLGVPGRLLFTRTTGNDVQTIFMAAGRTERRVTEPGSYCCLVRVSPDRRRILVMPGGDIQPPLTGGTIDFTGENFKRLPLTDPTLNLIPQAWSPDGRRIAFEGWDDSDPSRTGVYTARASDGGDLVRVTSRPGLMHDIPLDFSPDGRRLVFYQSSFVDPEPNLDGSLWTVSVDGSNVREIASAAVGPAPWARWSKDGRKILFANQRLATSGVLWTVNPDGSNLHTLFKDRAGGFPIDPVWSPNGSQVMFALDPTNDRFTHPDNALYVINADGTHPHMVLASPDFKSQLEWLP